MFNRYVMAESEIVKTVANDGIITCPCCNCTKFAFILDRKICRTCGEEVDYIEISDIIFSEDRKNISTIISRDYLPEISASIMYTRKKQKSYQDVGSNETKIRKMQNFIRNICSTHLTNNVISLAISYIVAIYETGFILRGKNLRLINIGSVYYAARTKNIPIILADLMNIFSCSKKDVTEGINIFIRFARIHKLSYNIVLTKIDPIMYIKRFVNIIGRNDIFDMVIQRYDTIIHKNLNIGGTLITFIISLIQSVVVDVVECTDEQNESLNTLVNISNYSSMTIKNKVSKIKNLLD